MPTPVPPTGNPTIDALLWGWKWDSTHLTVSFPSFESVYQGYDDLEGFTPFTQFQAQQIINFGLNNLSVFTGLTFQLNEVGQGDLRFAQVQKIDYGSEHTIAKPGLNPPGGTGSAEANPPDPFWVGAAASGDNWFTLGKYADPQLGSFQYAAGLLHEVGHSLGLKHGHNPQEWSNNASISFPALPAEYDSQEYSLMTYRSYVGQVNTNVSGNEEYPWTYMILDVAALQHLYGANFGTSANNGDNVYSFDPATGEMTIDGHGFGASYNSKIFLTLWDGGGVDLLDFTNYAQDQDINLRPGEFSRFSDAQLANLSNGQPGDAHFARGNIGNALLYQGDLRSLIEHVDTGIGHDHVVGNQIGNRIRTGNGFDTVISGNGADTVFGGNGRDLIFLGVGADLYGDNTQGGVNGRDTVYGNQGNDTIEGGNGDDAFYGGQHNDVIRGRLGNDILDGGTGADTLDGGDGNDSVTGGDGRDTVFLGAGNDTFFDNTQGGDLGRDTVFAAAGNDTIEGGNGNDEFHGQLGHDKIFARLGADKIFGGNGADTLDGGNGNDSVTGGNGRDMVYLGNGNDIFFDNTQGGDNGADTVFAGAGHDTLEGGNGGDAFYGGAGNDLIFARKGHDTLVGGAGNDTMDGGPGADTFVFGAGFGVDVINGYEAGGDMLQFDDALWSGTLSAAQVVNQFARVVGGDVVFDFGAEEVTLTGISSLTGLENDLVIV